jgi:hypothetical protein
MDATVCEVCNRAVGGRATLILLVVTGVGALGCGDDAAAGGGPRDRADEIEQSSQPIVGGHRAKICEWPTAVGASRNCTSTLVHPQIITTAGHCVADGGPTEITFGESWNPPGVVRTVAVKECFDGATSGIAGDFGFCVLAEPVTDVPIVPVLYGCEADILQPGQPAVLAGYGRRGGFSFSAGIKYAVDVLIDKVDGNDIYLGDSRHGGCNGDSGGPAFVQVSDGTWRVFGATSRGSIFCNSQTIYTFITPFVPWIEQISGIDITPCHDADGSWNPGPGCGGFPLNPQAGGGTWANMCADVERGGPGATCGAPPP